MSEGSHRIIHMFIDSSIESAKIGVSHAFQDLTHDPSTFFWLTPGSIDASKSPFDDAKNIFDRITFW